MDELIQELDIAESDDERLEIITLWKRILAPDPVFRLDLSFP